MTTMVPNHPTPVDPAELDDDGLPVGAFGPGDLLPGGVEAWERLGVGHRCETWLAWSPAMWGPVVAKFPRPHQRDHPRACQSLKREVAALGGNLHPGLPRLYTDGTDAIEPSVLLEYVDGPTLDDELAGWDGEVDHPRPMAPNEVVLLAVQVLSALRSVHARGLVHVDVKPANVLLRNGRPVLVDFGSSRRIGAAQPAGLLIGSSGYAAPELEAGARIDPAMDVYGLGVTLHEALTGIPTFDPDLAAADRPAPARLTATDLAASGTAPPASGTAPPASDVAELVLALLRGDPAARPSTAQALRAFSALAAASAPASWPSWPSWR